MKFFKKKLIYSTHVAHACIFYINKNKAHMYVFYVKHVHFMCIIFVLYPCFVLFQNFYFSHTESHLIIICFIYFYWMIISFCSRYLNTQHIKKQKFNDADLQYGRAELINQMLEIGEVRIWLIEYLSGCRQSGKSGKSCKIRDLFNSGKVMEKIREFCKNIPKSGNFTFFPS